MGKTFRISIGSIMVAAGVIFFILPGSIIFLLGGLLMLSYDVPRARVWLRMCQNSMATGARKLDRIMLKRRLR